MQNTDPKRRKRIESIKKLILISRMFVPSLILLLFIFCMCLLLDNLKLRSTVSDLRSQMEDIATDTVTYDELSGVYSTGGVDHISSERGRAAGDVEKYEGKKRIYLTFDDGPSVNTDDILDILGKYDVKATFFVVANENSYADEAYQRIVDEGHTLALHSFSHRYTEVYKSLDSFKNDISSLQEFLYERVGVWPRIYRFPGGSSNRVSSTPMDELVSYLDSEGIVYFDWNVVSGDAVKGGVSESTIIRNCTGSIDKYEDCVILMHDLSTMGNTVEALDDIINIINERGDCVFLPITDETVPVQHVPERADEWAEYITE